MSKLLKLFLFISIGLGLGISSAFPQEYEADYIDADYASCTDCHDEFHTLHPFSEGEISDPVDCQRCHGPASAHVDEGDPELIIRFDAGRCIACHTHTAHIDQYAQSPHGKNELSCMECHVIHVEDLDSEVADHLLTEELPSLCLNCHDEPASDHHPMPETGSCIACHNPHAAPQTEEHEKSQRCFVCHGRNPNVAQFRWSAHSQKGLECITCHVVHSERFDRPTLLCVDCHAKEQHEFDAPNGHMDKADCLDCHDPHERRPYVFEDRYSDRCIVCHEDKASMNAFPHEAGREQGCLECHQPHTPARVRLLESSPQFLCLSCHGDQHLGDQDKRMRSCIDCHDSFHGSHEDGRMGR